MLEFREWIDDRIGAGVLPIAEDTCRILLCLRSCYVNEPNTWAGWGGHGKVDETPAETAEREFREETGYLDSVKLIPAFVSNNGTKYYNFIGIVPKEFSPMSSPKYAWETADWKWLAKKELGMMDNLHPGLVALLSDPETRVVLSRLHFA